MGDLIVAISDYANSSQLYHTHLIIMPKLMLKLALMLLVAVAIAQCFEEETPHDTPVMADMVDMADMVVMVVMVDMVIMVDIVVLVDMAGVVKVIHHYCGGYGPGGSDCLFLQPINLYPCI